MTFLLLTLILTFVDRPRLMPYTAAAAASLVAVLVFTEAPVSGTSLNPARSIGPALVGATWTGLYTSSHRHSARSPRRCCTGACGGPWPARSSYTTTPTHAAS